MPLRAAAPTSRMASASVNAPLPPLGQWETTSREPVMDEHELAARAYELPGRFADRLDSAELAGVREYAEVGEWGEEIDLLLACLRGATVTGAERAEFVALLQAMGLPTEPAEELRVDGP
jgi:hypothetical protein